MTATQVFFRFAKENGCYDMIQKCVHEAYSNLLGLKDYLDESPSSLVKMHGNKSIIIDKLLKAKQYNLSDVLWILQVHSICFRNSQIFADLEKKWHKYIKKNLSGNYYKAMIQDNINEIDPLGFRNGYHALNFTFKQEK